MQSFLSSSPGSFRSSKSEVPYSTEALRQDLRRIRAVWEDCQATRGRNAIYAYLNVVYGLVTWWAAEGQEINRARRALRLQRLEVFEREDPFAAIIRCTAEGTGKTSSILVCWPSPALATSDPGPPFWQAGPRTVCA
jgi:hypothetical protein